MKYLTALLIFVSSWSFAQINSPMRVKTEVKSAIVYLDGAEVSREKTINLKGGKNEIVFYGLSSKINTKTIQINAPDGIDILSVSSKINFLTTDEENPAIQEMKDSLELLIENNTYLSDEKSAYEMEKQLLVNNMKIGGEQNGLLINELKNAADFYRSRLKDINGKTSKIIKSIRENQVIISKIQQQLQEANSKMNIRRAEVAVLVNSESSRSAKISLKYVVDEVGWIPSYDIRSSGISEPIQLVYRAKVYNNSDIDWNKVDLILSSADPTSNASKPVLAPWYLKYQNASLALQNAYSQSISSPSSSKAPMSMDINAESQKIGRAKQLNVFQKGNLEFTSIAISDISAEFKIEDKFSIPSNDKLYFIEIKEYELKATYKHFSIPKQSNDVFLLARITGWENLDILEGTANIYLNGTFTGQSFINTRDVNDTLDLSLGRDSKVQINRRKLSEFSSNKSIGSNRKETYAYEIAVKNNHNVPIVVEVLDQIPVPQDGDIEVSKIDLSDAEHDEITGLLTWKHNIKTGETKKWNMSFSVKYPKNKPINIRAQKYRKVRMK